MTEAKWFASTDPAALGAAVMRRKRASARVLRLYVAAFWSWQSHRLKTARDRAQLRRRAALVEEWAETGVEPPQANAERIFVGLGASAKEAFRSTVRAPKQWKDGNGPATKHAVRLLHEVFGNPFTTRAARKTAPRRGWMFSPSWRTDTAVALARQMYDSRDFGAMPILADALQDAGCDNDDILDHCRGPGEHVRGCWVVDLVLQKA
ncbi:MAG: hypothetical protein J0I06_16015 [Planctomycetes bacterium]|nr:hypothetical protein [Planctomycetota bacterium]